MSGDQIFQISAGSARVGKYEDAFAWEVCHWPLRVGAACLHLLQYNSIIASLRYNTTELSFCELSENLKLYSCLESMRAPDNMYYSLSGCSTISYCSLFCKILQNWCTNIVSFYEILQQWQFVIGTITTWYYCTNVKNMHACDTAMTCHLILDCTCLLFCTVTLMWKERKWHLCVTTCNWCYYYLALIVRMWRSCVTTCDSGQAVTATPSSGSSGWTSCREMGFKRHFNLR